MDKAIPTPYSHQGVVEVTDDLDDPKVIAKKVDDYMNNETEEIDLETALTSLWLEWRHLRVGHPFLWHEPDTSDTSCRLDGGIDHTQLLKTFCTEKVNNTNLLKDNG